jgi:hypothetical protein
MSDSAPPIADELIDTPEPQAETADEAPASRGPTSRPRYRPSEAWAMRWLGPARA